MEFTNLTPHTIVVCSSMDNVIAEFPSKGSARVQTNSILTTVIDGIEVVETTYGEVEELPEAEEGKIFLVSMVVYSALKQAAGNLPVRGDVLCPDTSPSQSVRYPVGYLLNGKDMTGMIFGVKRFTTY